MVQKSACKMQSSCLCRQPLIHRQIFFFLFFTPTCSISLYNYSVYILSLPSHNTATRPGCFLTGWHRENQLERGSRKLKSVVGDDVLELSLTEPSPAHTHWHNKTDQTTTQTPFVFPPSLRRQTVLAQTSQSFLHLTYVLSLVNKTMKRNVWLNHQLWGFFLSFACWKLRSFICQWRTEEQATEKGIFL